MSAAALFDPFGESLGAGPHHNGGEARVDINLKPGSSDGE